MINSRVLISNMTIVFSNSDLKIPKWGIFGLTFKVFLFLIILWSITNASAGFKYGNVFLKRLVKNTKVSQFLSQTLSFVVLQETLQFEKFMGADFKYHNTFFQIPPQKHLNKTLLGNVSPKVISFHTNLFAILWVLISNTTAVFSNKFEPKTIPIFRYSEGII